MKSSTYYQEKIKAQVIKKESYLQKINKINARLDKLEGHKWNALRRELKEAEFAAKSIEIGAITPEQKAKVEAI